MQKIFAFERAFNAVSHEENKREYIRNSLFAGKVSDNSGEPAVEKRENAMKL